MISRSIAVAASNHQRRARANASARKLKNAFSNFERFQGKEKIVKASSSSSSMTTTTTIGVESSTNDDDDDDDDDTVFDVLRLNAENVSESDELNNLAITERRTRAAEDERRKRLKAEIKDIENHLRVENSKENERRSREDEEEIAKQGVEIERRVKEDQRRVKADLKLESVDANELERLEKMERARRNEEELKMEELREKIGKLEKNDEDIASYAKEALAAARAAVKSLETELDAQKERVMKRRKKESAEAKKRVREMQRNVTDEQTRSNNALKGAKSTSSSGDDDDQELEKKRFEYKLRMDTEQHEKLLMDEARLQLVENADIKRVQVTLSEALVAVEKVKDEEGERRDAVQKELSVFKDEYAIKKAEVESRRRNYDAVLSSECEAVSIEAKRAEVQLRTDEEARRVAFTTLLRNQRNAEEKRRALWDAKHFENVQNFEKRKADEAATKRRENTRRSAFATSFAAKDANAAAVFLALYLETREASELSKDEDMEDIMEADGALYAAAERIRKERENLRYKRDFDARKETERRTYFANLEKEKALRKVKDAEREKKTTKAREEAEKLLNERISEAKAKREAFQVESKKRAEERREESRIAAELQANRRKELEQKRLKELEEERVRFEKRMKEEREAVNAKPKVEVKAVNDDTPLSSSPPSPPDVVNVVAKQEPIATETKVAVKFVATNPSTPIRRATGSVAKMKTDALWNENYKKFLKYADANTTPAKMTTAETSAPMPVPLVTPPAQKIEEIIKQQETTENSPKKSVPQSVLDMKNPIDIAIKLLEYDVQAIASAITDICSRNRFGSDVANEVFMALPKSISGAVLVNIEDLSIATKLFENCEPGRETVDLSNNSSTDRTKKFFFPYGSRKAIYAGVEILEIATSKNETRAVEIFESISRIPRASILKRAVLQQGPRPGTETDSTRPNSKTKWIAKLLTKIAPSKATQTCECFLGGEENSSARFETRKSFLVDVCDELKRSDDIEGASAFAKILESRLNL